MKSSIFIILLLALHCISCSTTHNVKNDKAVWEEANNYRSTITDTVFLKVRGQMSHSAIDPLNGSGWNKDYAYNQVVYMAALGRAKKHLSVEDNQFKYNVKSGAEINISEDLHLFITNVFTDWNKLIEEGQFMIVKDDEDIYDIRPVK